ncbi:MAG: chemotaxis protein CheW [Rhodoferax sp.]|nr:chemotaxis protein CheW [Rhodoferax sp.]
MANREAIRELQARLASRLQAARDEGLSVSWLAVRCGGRNFLFPLGQSGEIFPLGAVQPVPYSESWFRGVVNLRGGLYGVVDMAAFVDPGAERAAALAAERVVVTLNAALDVNCAILVDSLAGLRRADRFTAAMAPAADGPAYFGNLFTDADGQSWQEINLQTLSQLPRFLNITA